MGRLAMLVVVIAAITIGESMGNRNWQYGWGSPYKHSPYYRKFTENKINVGGSSNWTFGFNYEYWAYKHGVFYVNDTLVFKYDPPSDSNIHPHSVYLLPNFWSYKSCNLTNAVEIANETQGAENGFEFKLEKYQPYYFACGGGNGFHCINGTMKFLVMPQLHRYY